jgi:hypothetical protein
MKGSLVSSVDSTETLAPETAGGERLGMAYTTGIAEFAVILSASQTIARFAQGDLCPLPEGRAGFRSLDGLRGSLTVSVMGILQRNLYARPDCSTAANLLFLLMHFTNQSLSLVRGNRGQGLLASMATLAVLDDTVPSRDGEIIIGLELDGRVEAGERFLPSLSGTSGQGRDHCEPRQYWAEGEWPQGAGRVRSSYQHEISFPEGGLR